MEEKFDYSKIGLKCGLEIHQQLDTGKLFCNCHSLMRNDNPDFTIRRKLHVVAGESGEIDVAAKHEAEKDRDFIYEGYYDNTCLIELDEEPPHEINQDSLKIALQISILLNAKTFPLSQIMRKTVVDGSNTGGFQRTVLIARDGFVETEHGRVKIESICLEEDSARIIDRKKELSVYRLDRLGIPLIEVTTAPDIKTPEQAKEVALHIGDILRSCNVKRGIGTIRQDLNISIKKGARIEIKGFQDPAIMVKTINSEIKRQKEIIEKENEINSEVRKVFPDGTTEFLRPMPGAARMYPETDLPLLKISKDLIDSVKKNLPKLKSELEKDLMESGLSQEMIKILFKQNKLQEFKELLEIVDNPQLIAKLLLIFPKEISSREKLHLAEVENILTKDVLIFALENLKNKKIGEGHIKHFLERVVKGEKLDKAIVHEKKEVSSIEENVMKIIKDKPGLSPNAYMGLVMKEFKGKVDGKEVMEIIQKFTK